MIKCDICGAIPVDNDDYYYNVRETNSGKHESMNVKDTIQCIQCIEEINMSGVQSIVRIDNPMMG